MISVTFPATEEVKTQLGGEAEGNFVRLEQSLGVRLITRNPGITIQAETEAQAQRAKAALEKMALAVKSGQQLPEFYLNDLLTASKAASEPGSQAPVLDKPILMDRFGHAVQAKTKGQSRFVEVIKQHDMVFAAGPAGTGKTFLAVAMAV